LREAKCAPQSAELAIDGCGSRAVFLASTMYCAICSLPISLTRCLRKTVQVRDGILDKSDAAATAGAIIIENKLREVVEFCCSHGRRRWLSLCCGFQPLLQKRIRLTAAARIGRLSKAGPVYEVLDPQSRIRGIKIRESKAESRAMENAQLPARYDRLLRRCS
jgi:hypothetical protein